MIEPWSYTWVSFSGLKAEMYISRSGLNKDVPVIACKNTHKIEEYLTEMIKCKDNNETRDIRLMGLLYMFLSELISVSDEHEVKRVDNRYIQRAIEFIELNYNKKIQISNISSMLCLERKYFSKLFKEKTSFTPQEFLLRFRMKKACTLLANSEMPISKVATNVGYKDPFLFSKTFKKYNGFSPREYRKVYKNTTAELGRLNL